MKKIYMALLIAVVVVVGFGGSAGSAHAQTATAPATLSATDLNVLGQALSVFKNVLDEIQARLDAHSIPESSFSTLNATLEGMKGSLLTIRTALTQEGVAGLTPVAMAQEPAPMGVSIENQPASQSQSAAIASTGDAAQQSASIGLIARHPTVSLWVGIIAFVLIIGTLLFVRTRSDAGETKEKSDAPAQKITPQSSDAQ